jgi:hypothetical protein
MGNVNSVTNIENIIETVHFFCIIAVHASLSDGCMVIYVFGNNETYEVFTQSV